MLLLGGCLLTSEEPRVARALDFDELVDEDLSLLRNKTGPTRLGFALLLKFLRWKGRFPRGRAELPNNAVEHGGRQVGVPAAEIGLYEWDGRRIKRHRQEIRRALGFRQCSVVDAEKLTFWLAGNVAHAERREEQVREELLAHCRRERIEPPERTRVDRIVHSALRRAEEALFAMIAARLEPVVVARPLALAATGVGGDGEGGDAAQQYDQMIKYATAIRVCTASTEGILRRSTRTASHPTYSAMLEVGRAQKTLFTARYLRLRDLQREINGWLNAVESWNRANAVLCYGKGGDIATNRREEQEVTMLYLRILQAALVFVNTLMLQDVLADPGWAALLTDPDRRGLTPLFWTHVFPYGEIRLDMTRRLGLTDAANPLGAGDA